MVFASVMLRENKLLFALLCLLPFSWVPRELIPGGPGTAPVVMLLAVAVGFRYKLLADRTITGVEVAAGSLLFWIAFRLVVLTAAEGDPIAWYLVLKELGAIGSGIILFRIARRAEVKGIIVRALAIGLASLIVIELYQLLAGLPRLVSLGYSTENGYYYYTQAATYRPFGTFNGPTVFGAYLATVGAAVVLSIRRYQMVSGGALALAVLATSTRSAWLGLAVAAVTLLTIGRASLSRAAIPVFASSALCILTLLMMPGILNGVVTRFASISDASDTSRVTRTELWGGVIRSVSNDSFVAGHGAGDWTEIMTPLVGSTADLGHAHSNYFQELFRYGSLGLLLFVALLGTIFRELLHARKRGSPFWASGLTAAVIFSVDSIFNNTLSSTNFVMTIFLLVGFGSAPHLTNRGGAGRFTTSMNPSPRLPMIRGGC